MNVEYVLDTWKRACNTIGVKWFLYEETLLCAAGYHNFPDSLTCSHVAVFSNDLNIILKQVLPELPKSWKLTTKCFCSDRHMLLFRKNGVPVLKVYVLFGAENLEDVSKFSVMVRQFNLTANKREQLNKIGNLFPMYRQTFGNLIQRYNKRQEQEKFKRVVAMMTDSNKGNVFFLDRLVDKNVITLPAEWFSNRLLINCGNVEYPVFEGYRDYLKQVFGDYESGLIDEIGCGLTPKEKKELIIHQEKCMEALKFLQEVSIEFDLDYYLIAGSVLGCVRHSGFIPWDDDVDIGIRIEELERFENVLMKELPRRLPEKYQLMQTGANNPYPRMFSKICYDGRCCIDLWPLVPTYNEGFKAKLVWYAAKIFTRVHYKKIGHYVPGFYRISQIVSWFLSDDITMRLAKYNEVMFTKKDTPAYVNIYSIYGRHKETIQRKWLDDRKKAMFNGLEVPIVGCTDEYLTHLYGDYMKKPAPWNRASHHIERFFK